MMDETTPEGRILVAALRLAAERPWKDVTLLDIAERAGLSLVELKTHFSSKSDLLAAFTRKVDEEVLRRASKRPRTAGPRDALFEVVMSRFDVLAPYRDALRSILSEPVLDPSLARSALDSQRWMLEAAGISSDGLMGVLRVGGLASVYASVLRTWLEDEDPGLARTMAALDRRLRRGERTLSGVNALAEGCSRLAGIFVGRSARARRAGDAAPAGPVPGEPG
jgi:ubiquinone biosynthesis protein COQ9